MIVHDNAFTRSKRRHSDTPTVSSAYRREPGREFGWPEVHDSLWGDEKRTSGVSTALIITIGMIVSFLIIRIIL